jgi:ABC-type transport system involved in multi-copper enzyme maturation permease subunit
VSRLVRAEVLKLRTVRSLLWIAVGMVALVGISVISVVASTDVIESAGRDRSVARISAIAVLFALLQGIIVMGAEGTHGTITQTFLVAPVRERVLAAKALVAATVGVALAVVAEALTLVVAGPGVSLNVRDARYVFIGVVIASAAAGALGVGLGALYHRQGPAIITAFLWLLIGESVLAIGLRDSVRFLPAHVYAAAVAGTVDSSANDLLGAWSGALGAVLYAAGFLVAGGALLLRRDV